ncbi:hypothetical protein GCM10027422_40450 [Hymenobacter arcticus]
MGAAAVALLLTTGAAHAQADTGGPAATPQAPDPTAVPLDGGASLLLASGVALGLRKLRDRRRAR